MNKLLNDKNISYAVGGFLILFAVLDIILFTVNKTGVDTGYFLSISRDWISLGRIPGVDTFTAYTALGYMFYAIPYLFVENPSIETFWILNLCLFFCTTYIFFKIVNSNFEMKSIVFLIMISFIYNLHGVVNDIKLENLVLFLNTLIIYLINYLIAKKPEIIENRRYVLYGLIGFISALVFLTKQYGALSLLFAALILFYFRIDKWFRQGLFISIGFIIPILIYFTTQLFLGQSLEFVFDQLIGKMPLTCHGSKYGERQLSNLLIAFKYYRFDIVLILGAFLSLGYKIMKMNSGVQILHVVVFFLVLILLLQTPYYFKVFPHYKIFGIVFLYLMVIMWSKPVIDSYLKLGYINVLIIGMISLSSFSFYKRFLRFNELKVERFANRKFEARLNEKMPRSSNVFMLNDRRLWFDCGFVSPLPKTISYGFLGVDCVKEALILEKPKAFWIGSRVKITDLEFENYNLVERIDMSESVKSFYASFYILEN